MAAELSRIIHYCWFGGNIKSKRIIKCIESWKMYFSDWKIIEWNENNFDVHCNRYVSEAYDTKMWAFVSDYCRFWVLEKYGGIYFDTDVEVIRSFDDLIRGNLAFCGFETESQIAPGLVIYSKTPGQEIIRRTREYYDHIAFLDADGKRIKINVCKIFTDIISNYGFIPDGRKQLCGDMVVYPRDYFCPLDFATRRMNITENTYSIHWYDMSWWPLPKKVRHFITCGLHRIFGTDVRERIEGHFAKAK